MVAVEIDAGAIMIAAACAMASALLTLIFSTIAFQLSIESRLKMVHQAEILHPVSGGGGHRPGGEDLEGGGEPP